MADLNDGNNNLKKLVDKLQIKKNRIVCLYFAKKYA